MPPPEDATKCNADCKTVKENIFYHIYTDTPLEIQKLLGSPPCCQQNDPLTPSPDYTSCM